VRVVFTLFAANQDRFFCFFCWSKRAIVFSKHLESVHSEFLCLIRSRDNLLSSQKGMPHPPVLKHGPRSSVPERGWKYAMSYFSTVAVQAILVVRTLTSVGASTYQGHTKPLSCHSWQGEVSWNFGSSLDAETRKVMIYARTDWSVWKHSVEDRHDANVQIVLVWTSYGGERLIELPSSWFPPKCPTGSLVTSQSVALEVERLTAVRGSTLLFDCNHTPNLRNRLWFRLSYSWLLITRTSNGKMTKWPTPGKQVW